ncbi:MAG: response regulator transcription factor [Anaerolineae bacterium]
MAHVLVVDDDRGIRNLIARALGRRGHTVALAEDGQEAMQILRRETPDLAILDVILPLASGLDVCRFMRTHPQLRRIPILFLTQRQALEDKVAGFGAGADDYLTKPFALAELELRVAALLRRSPVVTHERLLVGSICLNPNDSSASVDGHVVSLTPVEFELLRYLVEHAGQTVTADHLLRAVWAYPADVGSTSLVRMHILNLRRKIEQEPSNPKFLRTVPRHGYMIVLEQEP